MRSRTAKVGDWFHINYKTYLKFISKIKMCHYGEVTVFYEESNNTFLEESSFIQIYYF